MLTFQDRSAKRKPRHARESDGEKAAHNKRLLVPNGFNTSSTVSLSTRNTDPLKWAKMGYGFSAGKFLFCGAYFITK